MSPFELLPLEIHLNILAQLPLRDLAITSRVNHRWCQLCNNEGLWKQLCHQYDAPIVIDENENLTYKQLVRDWVVSQQCEVIQMQMSGQSSPLIYSYNGSQISLESFELLKIVEKPARALCVIKVRNKINSVLQTLVIMPLQANRENLFVWMNASFTPKLTHMFKTHKLYTVLQECVDRPFYYQLSERHHEMTERDKKLYFAEILLALMQLEAHGIQHSTFKSHWVFMKNDGHLMLYNHEMQQRQDKDTDYGQLSWQLGAFLLELHGVLSSTDPSEWTRKLSNASKDALDLMQQLLDVESSKRLRFHCIKHHPYLRNINWAKLARKEYVPSFIPYLHEEPPVIDGPPVGMRAEDTLTTPAPSPAFSPQFSGFTYTG